MSRIPRSHPRYRSLIEREKLVEGFLEGYVVPQGLIAHGRGEAFDYLIGERTLEEALEAERAAVAAMLLAENPVISVNGNAAALSGREIVELARILDAKIEVNLFHRSEERVRKIIERLRALGAERVLGENPDRLIPGLESERAKVCSDGIYSADVVLVPLEDGDRTEALVRMGKLVIAIDLNPLSRTSRMASITIVDNITRAIPNMIELARELRKEDEEELRKILNSFDNAKNLARILERIEERLRKLGEIWREGILDV